MPHPDAATRIAKLSGSWTEARPCRSNPAKPLEIRVLFQISGTAGE